MLSTLDLFSGAGGLTLGFKEAGFDCFAAVEIDRSSVETFTLHSPSSRIYDTDVCNVDFKYLNGKIDVVIGGPPCQPFSIGGLRDGELDSRDMVPEFIRVVEEVKPLAFVMENVPGLATFAQSNYFSKVLNALNQLGYQITWKILKTEDYGIPQIRRRLIIVGIKNSNFIFPEPTHGHTPHLLPIVNAGTILKAEPLGIPNNCKVYYAKKVQLRPSPHHGLLFNGGGRCINLNKPAPTIISSAGGNKTHFIDILGNVTEYHNNLMQGGPVREGFVPGCRRITSLESALIQTFPENIKFCGPTSSQYRQVGNAVPVKLAKIIAEALKDQLINPNNNLSHAINHIKIQSDLFDNNQQKIKI